MLAGCARSASRPLSPATLAKSSSVVGNDACEAFRASLPSDWIQGFLSVPEDPSQEGGRRIRIFYYGRINAQSIPTVYFNGGPGNSSHVMFATLMTKQPFFDPYKQISLIFIDQRGTGCSDPYPNGSDIRELRRLSFYGSRGIVADAEAVRAILWPHQKWIAAGQSYGGFVVHRYVILHPEALSAAISQQDVLTTNGYFRIKTRIASQARVLEGYLNQYSDDRERLLKLRDFLDTSKCFTDPKEQKRICGFSVLKPLTRLIGFSDQWLKIHQWLGIMVPDAGVSVFGIARFLKNSPSVEGTRLKAWAESVIGYVDRGVPPLDLEQCRRIQNDLRSNGIYLEHVLLNECMDKIQAPLYIQSHAKWQNLLTSDPPKIEDFASAIKDHLIPFYLYSGEKDTFVPVAEFSEELKAISTLPNVHYFDFSDSGHDGAFEEPRTWADWIRLSTPGKN